MIIMERVFQYFDKGGMNVFTMKKAGKLEWAAWNNEWSLGAAQKGFQGHNRSEQGRR